MPAETTPTAAAGAPHERVMSEADIPAAPRLTPEREAEMRADLVAYTNCGPVNWKVTAAKGNKEKDIRGVMWLPHSGGRYLWELLSEVDALRAELARARAALDAVETAYRAASDAGVTVPGLIDALCLYDATAAATTGEAAHA